MGTPITIDELAQKAGVSPVSLLERDMCTDDDILALARFCDSWQLTGHYLKLSEREISAVDEENKTVELKRVGILKKWRKKNAFYATYRAFIDVFLEQDDALTAYKICQEFQKRYCQSEAQSASQPSHSLAQSDSGYGSQLNLLSQQSGAAIADEDADTASYKLTPQLSVEPPKDGHFNDSAYGSQLSATAENSDSVDLPSQSLAPVASLPSVEPLIQLTEEGDPQCVLDELIVKEFGPNSKLQFRLGQKEAIINVLSGTSTLVILPVGSGKSLCYQLPAYLYSQHSKCITLVISPLISLMEDQIRNLPDFLKGAGACLHHNQTVVQQNDILKDVVKGKIRVLLLTPEALEGGTLWCGRSTPYSLSRLPPVAFACIDEVHCVSEWSHNFRPSYMRLQRVLRDRLRVHCVLGLTATATPITIHDVTNHFDIDQANIITGGSVLPNHLNISISCVEDKDKALI